MRLSPLTPAFVLGSTAIALLVLSGDRTTEACTYTGYTCPCQWEMTAIPVYAHTLGTDSRRLQNLSPARSSQEWEQIITNSLNIYREQLGIPVRLYFAGHVGPPPYLGDRITIEAEPDECDNSNAYAHFEPDYENWPFDTINYARIELRTQAMFGGVCQTINWSPLLLDEDGTTNKDPVNVLDHEFGHALGLDHPDNYCSQPYIAAVMNSSTPVWGRHFTRDDKESFKSIYGIRTPTGKTSGYDFPTNAWYPMVDWPAGTGTKQYRPGSLASGGDLVVAMWGNTNVGGASYGQNTVANGWANVNTQAEPTWNSISTVRSGPQSIRVYFLREWSDASPDSARKRICYRDSANNGVNWTALACPTVNGEYIMTRRDGLSATFDYQTGNYVVVYNKDDDNEADGANICNPFCNRIAGLTHAGPGSQMNPTRNLWVTTQASFGVPSITCRNIAAGDRCIIAFGTPEHYPYLRWLEGGIAPGVGGGQWVQTDDRAQTGIKLDQGPSVVWSDGDSRFHIAVQRRYRDTSRLDTYYKIHAQYSSWAGQVITYELSSSISAASLGTMSYGGSHYLRMYFMRNLE